MSKAEKAVQVFDEGFNCAQAVFAVFCEEMGLDKEKALKVASGFGGGMRMGETCGAVTGALMVIGMKMGQSVGSDKESKEKTNACVRKFIDAYRAKNETVICKELLGYDTSTAEGLKQAREKGLFQSKCPLLIKDAVNLLEEIL